MKRTHKVTRDKLVSLMAKVPLFSSLSGSERSQIAEHAHIYVANEGEAIIEKEATDTCFYILLSGSAKIVLERRGEPVAYVKPGEFFGEIGFILHTPRTSWIIADAVSALLRVDQMLINSLDNSTREKLKDQIILKLAKTVQVFNQAGNS